MAVTFPHEHADHCPSCTRALETRLHEGRELSYCPDCDLRLFRNPVPMGRATVVTADSALLIERGRGGDVGTWATPGGHVEYDEPPRVAAARELEEETGLAVDADDLTLVGDGFLDFGDGVTMVSFNYAAPRSAATGTVEAGDDAADARFWSREELVADTPLLRASGLSQILDAMDELGEH